MKIQFDVDFENQTITRTDSNEPVSDSVNSLEAEFTCTGYDDDATLTPLFVRGTKLPVMDKDAFIPEFEENEGVVTCYVPGEVIHGKGFIVSIFAYSADAEKRVTVNKLVVGVVQSGFNPGDSIPQATPTVYEQIIALLEEADVDKLTALAEQITTTTTESIASISTLADNSISNINTLTDTSIANINTLANNSISNINTVTNTDIANINEVVNIAVGTTIPNAQTAAINAISNTQNTAVAAVTAQQNTALNNIATRESTAISNMATQESTLAANLNTNANNHIQNIDTEAETKIEEIQSIMAEFNSFNTAVVDELPTEDIDEHTIYFVPRTETSEGDVYDEYIYINEAWELVGNTDIDLSNYATLEALNTLKSSIDDEFTNYATTETLETNVETLQTNIDTVDGKFSDYATTEYVDTADGTKVNVSQGAGNAGKALMVDDDGNVTAGDYIPIAKTWRAVRSITIPGADEAGTVDGVTYYLPTDGTGITRVAFETDKDGNSFEGRQITSVYMRFTPVEETAINQGFVALNGTNILYFTTLNGSSSTANRYFQAGIGDGLISPETYGTYDKQSTGQYAYNRKAIGSEIDKISFRGYEDTSVLGEGALLNVWAYGYWNDLEE